MAKIIPFFEVNGQRYEIKRTRYLLAEYDKETDSNTLTDEEKANATTAQMLIADIQKYGEKTQEFWDKFCETADDEDEKKYLKFKSLYNNALKEYALLGDSTKKIQKQGVDKLEKIAIKGIAEQYSMSETEAEKIWCAHVDIIGKDKAVEWLAAMAECLFGNDNEEIEDNSFLAQMRKKAEEKAINRKNGIKKK